MVVGWLVGMDEGGVIKDQDGGQVIATARSLVKGIKNVMLFIG